MDIISLPLEYDTNKIDGRYRVVAIASQRAKELALGVKPKIKTKTKKITSIAIEETVSGSIEFLTGEEAKKAKEEDKKFDYRRLLEEREKAVAGEEVTELEKDLKVYLHEKETTEKKALEDLFGERKEEGVEE
ncbi:MAG TPA: DNA-directed RNA polymerase subunit omega [Thermodesulfovibrionales bacterium]|nr:DNA-directed RNA polymerase subunit omega [Thermodesulfovibrionales bacterium]